MKKFAKFITFLILICTAVSVCSVWAAADCTVHIPGPDGCCTVCGVRLVTENYFGNTTVSSQTVSVEGSTPVVPDINVNTISGSGVFSGCSHIPGENGKCTICEELLVAVNSANVYFTSLQDALNRGGNVRLLCDIDFGEDTAVTVKYGQSVSLDLNGKKLGTEHLVSINNYGTFTLCDSSEDKGELFGSIYTKAFEEREYIDEKNYKVTNFAYGAKTVVQGGRILGDVVVGHEEGMGYAPDASKPNPSLVFENGYMIGGRFSLPEENKGSIVINGGFFTVEPPEKFVRTGYEADWSDGYYHVVRTKYVAGWEPSGVFADASLDAYARSVAKENDAVNKFYTEDLGYVDVSDILLANGLTFDPDTDHVVCSIETTAISAVTEGDGVNEKVSTMTFAMKPVFRMYRNGEKLTQMDITWAQVPEWGTTFRLPVDSRITNKYVNVYAGTAPLQEKVEVITADSGKKYAQLYVNKTSFEAGLSYVVYVPETCAVTFAPNGGIGETVYNTVAGGGSITLPENPFTREYYSFAGWKCNDGTVYAEGQTIGYVIDDMSFSAAWTPDSYGIFYQLDGGTNNDSNPLEYDYDDTIILADPVREGAEFAGWYAEENFSGEPVVAINPGEYGDKVLYAKWMVTVSVVTSGDGNGTVSDSERQYVSGDSVKLLSGENFSLNIFNADGSYIGGMKINGEDTDVQSFLSLTEIRENTVIEILFLRASESNGQTVDFSNARAEDGGALTSSLLNRAEDAFANANVLNFSDTGIADAVDLKVARAAFAAATGENVGEFDNVSVYLQMSVLTVKSDDGSRVTGYKMDIKPMMTVISTDGTVRNGGKPVVVPNEAILHPVTFRIPVDTFAYMDDAVAFHEGELMGYFKIEGESPNRYIELTADSFSVFEVQVVLGNTNHPEVAIGQYGYTTLAKAVEQANAGDVIYILVDKNELTVPGGINGYLNSDAAQEKSLAELINSLTTDNVIHVKKGTGEFLIRIASEDMIPVFINDTDVQEGDIVIVYIGNGGKTTDGKNTVVDSFTVAPAVVKDITEIGFEYAENEFTGWIKADGASIAVGTGIEEDTTLYAGWRYKAEVNGMKYESLNAAYNACPTRGTIKLLTNIVGETVSFNDPTKELLLDLNGFTINGKTPADSDCISVAADLKVLPYGDTGNNYQIRKKYNIAYEYDEESGASLQPGLIFMKTSFRDEAVPVYKPTPGMQMNNATFEGWYYDQGFTSRLAESADKSSFEIGIVSAPAWPEDITVYGRWTYTISVYFNNYGTVLYGGQSLASESKIVVNRYSDNSFDFRPHEGYRVYNVTVNGQKLGEHYAYSFNNIRDNGTLVVTFARGKPTVPFTGDDGMTGMWTALMGLSGIMIGMIMRRNRKEKRIS